MTELPAGLATWARMPGPAKVMDAVIQRIRRGFATEYGVLNTAPLSADERKEIGRLLGTKWEVSGSPVRLQYVAERVAEHGLTVRQLAEAVHGPIEENRVLRDRAAEAAAAERTSVAQLLGGVGVNRSAVDAWLIDSMLPGAGGGDLTDLAKDCAEVWKSLPHNGKPVPLARLAADLRQDAHALDADRLLGRAVARLAAITHDLPRPQRAGWTWRGAWAAVGVRCDTVSSRVLALNLPLSGTAAVARVCTAAVGEPTWLTLRSLDGQWASAGTPTVFVCENVTVVEAAADTLDAECPPLVATDGIASGAALELIAGLANSGCTIRARADFDPSGFVVAEQVLSVAPDAVGWRFDANHYLRAAGVDHIEEPTMNLLHGIAALRNVHRDVGIPVHEERILDQLLHDLREAAE